MKYFMKDFIFKGLLKKTILVAVVKEKTTLFL